jgi:hypothetical protein
MKLPRFFLSMLAGISSLAGVASGASYSTNFAGYILGEDLVGQNGWISNDTTADVAVIAGLGTVWGSRSATLGYVAPVIQDTVYVSHPCSVPLVGNGYTTFSAMFQVVDSDSGNNGIGETGAENRDVFGFRLQDGAGNDVFTFRLNPFDQDALPEEDTNYNLYSWTSDSVVGEQQVLRTPLIRSAQESFAYTVTISFATSGADVNFTGTINGVDPFYGTLPGLAGVSVQQVGAIWDPTFGPSAPGSNFMIFDNISMVPETSSALLGLLGASLALVRRRRI